MADELTTAQKVTAAQQRGDDAEVQRLRDAWTERTFAGRFDEDLAQSAFYTDAHIIEHNAHCCCDEWQDCPAVTDGPYLRALFHEMERRERTGQFNPDPNAPTLEERLGPYGIEWQIEQRERQENR